MKRRWVGILSDLVAGNAHIQLDLPEELEKGKKVSGEAELKLSFTQNFELPDFSAILRFDAQKNRVVISHDIDTQAGIIPFEFSGEVIDADPFARFALFGSYRTKGVKDAAFKGGSLVLWRFAGAEETE